jgi:hypothetical protein
MTRRFSGRARRFYARDDCPRGMPASGMSTLGVLIAGVPGAISDATRSGPAGAGGNRFNMSPTGQEGGATGL